MRKMTDVDFDATQNLNTQNANGTADGRNKAFTFEPMRRKLHIPKDHAE